MNDFERINARVERFNIYLDKLYYAGKLKLSDLQSFRGILADIRGMFDRLRELSPFGIIPRHVRRDLNRLVSELTLMEYNVSLISMSSICAA